MRLSQAGRELLCVRAESPQSFPTVWDPMDWVACQAPLSMEFCRQEYWSGLLVSSSEDLPDPGIELMSPGLQADSLLSKTPGKPEVSKIPSQSDTVGRVPPRTASPKFSLNTASKCARGPRPSNSLCCQTLAAGRTLSSYLMLFRC